MTTGAAGPKHHCCGGIPRRHRVVFVHRDHDQRRKVYRPRACCAAVAERRGRAMLRGFCGAQASVWRVLFIREHHDITGQVYEERRHRPPQFVPACLRELGLGAEATEEDVRRAYRERAKTDHPDQGGTTAAFQHLGKIYEEALAWVRRRGEAA